LTLQIQMREDVSAAPIRVATVDAPDELFVSPEVTTPVQTALSAQK
jgi:hypothetical protein